MVLHEFHIFQWHSRPVGHRHTITGFDCTIGRKRKDSPGTTGGHNHGLGVELKETSAAHFHRHHAPALTL